MAGLAFGLPAVVALFAAAKPVGYLEERGAPKAQQAAGIPVQPPLMPPWVVAVIDGAVTVTAVMVAFLALAALADRDRWTAHHLQAVTSPTGAMVLAVGAVTGSWHYWRQTQRVHRSTGAQLVGNRRYLGSR